MIDHDYGFEGEMFPLPVLSEEEEIDIANEELLFEHEHENAAARAIEFDIACQSTATCRLEFREPLTPEQKLMIQLLAERYEDKSGIPFMVLSRDGVTTLIVPRALRRIGYGSKDFDPNEFAVETPSLVRLPDGTGASNGLPSEGGN